MRRCALRETLCYCCNMADVIWKMEPGRWALLTERSPREMGAAGQRLMAVYYPAAGPTRFQYIVSRCPPKSVDRRILRDE